MNVMAQGPKFSCASTVKRNLNKKLLFYAELSSIDVFFLRFYLFFPLDMSRGGLPLNY